MNRTKLIAMLLLIQVGFVGLFSGRADEWMTYRSTYTHDNMGRRVDQHTLPVEPLSPDQGNLVRSGYRHYRSTIQGSTSADNLHITHEWGRPVMPYEHWRFPYRPYGAPYDQWGPPVPNVLSNFNYQGAPWPTQRWAPGMNPGMNPGPNPGMNPGPNPGMNPPWNSGNYPGFNQGLYSPGMVSPGIYPPGTVPPTSAPWIDGLYPSAPPLR